MAKKPKETHTPDAPEDSPDMPAGALGEISQGPGAFETFLDEHHRKILVLGLAAAAAVAAYVINDGLREGRETAGGHAIHEAAADIESLRTVLENHGESRAAGSAAVLLAESQWEQDQRDDAVTTLRDFIATAGDHPARPTALASLGSKLAEMGKSGEAAEAFRTLIDARPAGIHLAPFALIGLGDLAQQAGDIDEARSHFTRVRNDFPTSPFNDTAASRIAILDAEVPVTVEPPAEPEEEDSDPEETTGLESPEPTESTREAGPDANEPDVSESTGGEPTAIDEETNEVEAAAGEDESGSAGPEEEDEEE